MPRPKPKQITAASYSRHHAYTQCPFRAKLKYIDKLEEPTGPPLIRGSKIHKLAEDYVTARIGVRVPDELKTFSDEFKALRKLKQPVLVEIQWAFKKDWSECTWFDYETYCRVMLDAVVTNKDGSMQIIDYKTGKVREEQKEQLELYAIAGLIMFPEVESISAEFWYLDHGVEIKETYHRKDLKKMQKKWDKNFRPMLNDKQFAPRPGNACRWCHFKKANGGPCEF